MIRSLRALRAVACFLFFFVSAGAFSNHARAQQDLVDDTVEDIRVRSFEGFDSEVRDGIRWVYPEGSRSLMLELKAVAERHWTDIGTDLGVRMPLNVEIRIGRNPEEMRALAPLVAPPPAYATGVAYTRRGLIVLSMEAPGSWEPPELSEVLVHELSHIALRSALPDAELPRWFVEGLAIRQSGERGLARLRTLHNAEMQDELRSLSELEGPFGGRHDQVSVAYAQSAALVGALMNHAPDESLRHLVAELQEGKDFSTAMVDAYAITPQTLYREWRIELEQRVSRLPTILGSTTIWLLAIIVFVVAWRKRRKRERVKRAAMQAEEEARAAAIERLIKLSERARPIPADALSHRLMFRRDRIDEDLPTIEVDGQRHILH